MFSSKPEPPLGAALVQAVPLDVNTLPDVPAAVSPVPPDPTANVADNPAAVPDVFWFSVGNVQLVSVPDVGVPNIGVTNVGEVFSTTEPEPVPVVTPVPPPSSCRTPEALNCELPIAILLACVILYSMYQLAVLAKLNYQPLGLLLYHELYSCKLRTLLG